MLIERIAAHRQMLASFLAVPYGVDGGRLNLNVGAVIGSYLVLDEFQGAHFLS